MLPFGRKAGDRVIAAWTQGGTVKWGSGPIVVAASADGGKTWKNGIGKVPGLPPNTWVSYVEASPHGYMLFINNLDKPGIVGAVGTILGQSNINTASITFGREVEGGLVVSVVNVDSKVSEETIEKLRKTKNILFVKLIKV